MVINLNGSRHLQRDRVTRLSVEIFGASLMSLPISSPCWCLSAATTSLWKCCPGPNDSSVDVEPDECFEVLGLTQLVTEPTRRTPSTSDLLDVFATSSSSSRTANVKVIDVTGVTTATEILVYVCARIRRNHDSSEVAHFINRISDV